MTLFAGSEAVRRVYILSGTDGSVLGEVDALKLLDVLMFPSPSVLELRSRTIFMSKKQTVLPLFIE